MGGDIGEVDRKTLKNMEKCGILKVQVLIDTLWNAKVHRASDF